MTDVGAAMDPTATAAAVCDSWRPDWTQMSPEQCHAKARAWTQLYAMPYRWSPTNRRAPPQHLVPTVLSVLMLHRRKDTKLHRLPRVLINSILSFFSQPNADAINLDVWQMSKQQLQAIAGADRLEPKRVVLDDSDFAASTAFEAEDGSEIDMTGFHAHLDDDKDSDDGTGDGERKGSDEETKHDGTVAAWAEQPEVGQQDYSDDFDPAPDPSDDHDHPVVSYSAIDFESDINTRPIR